MNDFLLTMKSAAVGGRTKGEPIHHWVVLVYIFANFHFKLPKHWVHNLSVRFML